MKKKKAKREEHLRIIMPLVRSPPKTTRGDFFIRYIIPFSFSFFFSLSLM